MSIAHCFPNCDIIASSYSMHLRDRRIVDQKESSSFLLSVAIIAQFWTLSLVIRSKLDKMQRNYCWRFLLFNAHCCPDCPHCYIHLFSPPFTYSVHLADKRIRSWRVSFLPSFPPSWSQLLLWPSFGRWQSTLLHKLSCLGHNNGIRDECGTANITDIADCHRLPLTGPQYHN